MLTYTGHSITGPSYRATICTIGPLFAVVLTRQGRQMIAHARTWKEASAVVLAFSQDCRG